MVKTKDKLSERKVSEEPRLDEIGINGVELKSETGVMAADAEIYATQVLPALRELRARTGESQSELESSNEPIKSGVIRAILQFLTR